MAEWSLWQFWVYTEVRMISFVGEKWGDTSGSTRGIVVSKFRQGQQFGPVVLLVIAIYAEILSNVWLVRSAWLFASRWYPLVKWSLLSRAVPREWKKWETNSEPWSDVTWDGTPCFEKMWITKRRASSAEVMVSWVGMNMACFDRQSTITRMVLKPEEKGSFSMKSIEIEFHGRSRIGVVGGFHMVCDAVVWISYR